MYNTHLKYSKQWDRVKIGGYRNIDLLHTNFRYGLDISENDVIKFSDMSKNGHIVKKKL
jgi:hypothetical protein